MALALGRHRFRGAGFTRGLLYLPVIIPEIVLGAALVTFFGAASLRLSLATVVIAHVVFCISYVAIVVRARLSGFDRSLEEAALDLGARPVATFVRVTLPLIAPGIVAGALLAFTISIDDYVITSFVAGVGATTLPLQIYSMLKVGVTPEVNADLDAAARRHDRADRDRPETAAGAGRARRDLVKRRCLALAAADRRSRRRPAAGRRRARRRTPGPARRSSTSTSGRSTSRRRSSTSSRVGRASRSATTSTTRTRRSSTKLESGVADYDLVVPSDYMVRILVHLKLLRPLDKARLKNLGNIDPRFLDRKFDPSNAYSLPYLWGTTGYGYDREKAGARRGQLGAALRSPRTRARS